jgi:hypothetical protein
VVVIVCSWIYDYLCISVHITTKDVSSNPVHGEVYSIQHHVKSLSVTCDRYVVFSGSSGCPHQ